MRYAMRLYAHLFAIFLHMFLTDFTFERRLYHMGFHMSCAITLRSKPLTTDGALVEICSCLHMYVEIMLLQVMLAVETHFTVGAFVCFDSSVAFFVSPQVVAKSEIFLAHITLVRLLPGVHPHMFFEAPAVAYHLITYGALQFLLLSRCHSVYDGYWVTLA